MENNLKIVTHDGIFHADEIFAIATLLYFRSTVQDIEDENYEIIRTRDKDKIEQAKSDADIYVIDVGGEYDIDKKNFDHHHDIDLVASNLLMLIYLEQKNLITENVFNELYSFNEGISDWDRNSANIHAKFKDFNKVQKYRLLSQLIAGFNRDPRDEEKQAAQFHKALQFAIKIVGNEYYSALSRIDADRIWAKAEKKQGYVIMQEFCSVWQEKAEAEGLKYGIYSPKEGQWNLQIVNSIADNLPDEGTIKGFIGDNFVFLHPGRFVAGFKTLQSAEAVAKRLIGGFRVFEPHPANVRKG